MEAKGKAFPFQSAGKAASLAPIAKRAVLIALRLLVFQASTAAAHRTLAVIVAVLDLNADQVRTHHASSHFLRLQLW
jgi:hypothetical protein